MSITHISKEDFLPAFCTAFRTTFTESNIRGGFRGSGLVPYNPEYVISQLEVRVQTPSRPSTAASLPAPWVPKTPNTSMETHSQTSFIQNKVVRHQDSSPTHILHSINQLAKGAKLAITELALLRAENTELRKANDILSKRRRTKKHKLQNGESLTIADAQNLESIKSGASQVQVILPGNALRTKSGPSTRRRCGLCGEYGHNVRTCKDKEEEPGDSGSDNAL
jgi:hypothetical protein